MTDAGEIVALPVRVDRTGVYVGGRAIADPLREFNPGREARLQAVRERMSPDWWRSAAAILDAEIPHYTGGPVGAGVDFFADDHGDAIPADVRQQIQEDAYDAAREVIVQGIEDHLRRMAPAVAALAYSGSFVETPHPLDTEQ